MPRIKSPRELTTHTMKLFKGDFEWLQTSYPELGASRVIRELVAAHIREVEGRLTPPPPLTEEVLP